jgi:ABC-2 type transport system permease protein
VSTNTYARLEVLRTLRNGRLLIFSLAFPLVWYLALTGSNHHAEVGGISTPLYYMIGMASFGCMVAVLASGYRISMERLTGWTHQMRTMPLTTRAYFASKLLSSYVTAVLALALLYVVGLAYGVHLRPGAWGEMTLLVLVGLVPFVVLGIVLGQLISVDAMGPAMGGFAVGFNVLGGGFGPLATSGPLHHIVEGLPSYWLIEAGRLSVNGHWWPPGAWAVLAVWTVILGVIALQLHQHRSTAS